MSCMSRCNGYPGMMPMALIPVMIPMSWGNQVQVREIEVDATTTERTAVTGGHADSCLTVEYYVDPGATDPSVTLTMVASGQTTTWTDQAIASGYHVHEQSPPMAPGTKLTLQASNALARVRWCETVCC